MDKRIAIPAGLAIMVALAVIGVMSIFIFTATQPAEASIANISQDLQGNADLGKLTEPFASPLTATAAVTGVAPLAAPAISPRKPGVPASLTFQFVVNADLQNGVDEIILTLDEDFGVPATLDRNQITISSNSVTNAGTSGQAVAPQEVTIDKVGVKQRPQISLRVPDMDLDDNSGGNGIASGGAVTVIFRQGAGITTPSEGKTGATGYDWAIRVTTNPGLDNQADIFQENIFIPQLMDMSSDDAKRSGSLTLVGQGVEGGESITFFKDSDLDGVRDATERDLCTVVTASSDIATCTFNVSNPPFVPALERLTDSIANVNDGGSFLAADTTLTHSAPTTAFAVGELLKIEDEYVRVVTVTNTTTLVVTRGVASTAADHADGLAINRADVNFINFVDSEGRTTSGATTAAIDAAALARQNLELDQTTQVSPAQANVGDRVTISLFDFPPGTVTAIQIGGTPVKAASLPTATVPTSGEVSFTFQIPGLLEGDVRTPTGTVPIKVFAGGQNEDFNVTIAGALLTLSHALLIPNQDLTITGSGFSEGSGTCVLQGQITINNVAVEIDDADDCDTGDGVLLTSGGSFTLTVRVHDGGSTTSINTALLTEGTHELKVIDTAGAEGTINVTIPERTLSVNPLSARPRDEVTIIGRNFIADNSDGLSATVDVEYQCGTNTRNTTADPDVSGNFREVIRIPTGCSIPSTNTITAKIRTGGVESGVVETVTHEIPEALVTIDPIRGASGDPVTIRGIGFRTFESVEKVEFGDLGVLGGRSVNTDANGNFTVTGIIVPGEDPGIHSVKVEVGTGNNRVTSSTSFEIIEASGFAGAITTPIEDALAPLFADDTLDRVFFFNNTTKEWTFFINDDAFSAANSLDDIPSGLPIWIKVTGDTTVELNNVEFDLTCVNPGTPEEDCWNLIVFP